MLSHALPSATWEFQGRGVDQHRKAWFCGRDVCKILGYQDNVRTLQRGVKNAYKSDLESIQFQHTGARIPVPYHEAKVVYISEPDLYQLIFLSWLKLLDKIHLCYLMHCLVLHGNFREDELISMGKSGFVAGVCVVHWNMIQKHKKTANIIRTCQNVKVSNEQCTCLYTNPLVNRFAKIWVPFSFLLLRYPLY